VVTVPAYFNDSQRQVSSYALFCIVTYFLSVSAVFCVTRNFVVRDGLRGLEAVMTDDCCFRVFVMSTDSGIS